MEDKDTAMGEAHDPHRFPSLDSLSHDIPQLQPTTNENPASFFSQTVLTSTSPGQPSDHVLIKRDSLLEPNSDWSDKEDKATTKGRGLPLASLATGLCYDVRMRYHCEVRPTTDVHPEDPRRIYYIHEELRRADLVDGQDTALVPRPLKPIPVRNATEEEISLVHSRAHFAFVRSTQDMSDKELLDLEDDRDSIYFNKLTFASSLLSAGGAIETCLAVARRQDVKNAIAVIRPPGHHAEHDMAMGFCLFNNVSVAARACQRQLGDRCRKVMILDWDVHHGNGIQKTFYDDPNVLYISIHVYQNGRFYPGGDGGNWDHCGEGAGLGKNVNIPWPEKGMGDGDYMLAFQQVVMPIAQEFDPGLVIVAAGFDAAAGDELGGCFVSPACYAHMTRMLMRLAKGKLAVCLEGGYNFRSISKSALAVTKTLMGEPPDRLLKTTPTDLAIATVREVMAIQSPYWSCMRPMGPTNNPDWVKTLSRERLHDVVRIQQFQELHNTFKLTPLYIYRTDISKSFEKQVLASPNYSEAKSLVVIFHDEPEIKGLHHPVKNRLELHNCLLDGGVQPAFPYLAELMFANLEKGDPLRGYIEWIVGKSYGVIDVNVPKHIIKEEAKHEEDDENRPTSTKELASYLWDNYIECSDAKHIFFLGIGYAYLGVANLLSARETVHQRVNGVISFVANTPVRAVKSSTQAFLTTWYKENSLVFVSRTHGLWKRDKVYKRSGKTIKSLETELSDMLPYHMESVFKWIAERADEPEKEDEMKD